MALSRREFVRRIGAGGAGVAAASHLIGYGREELFAFDFQGQGAGRRPPQPGGPAPIRLSSNENLRGPSQKVIDALKAGGVPGILLKDYSFDENGDVKAPALYTYKVIGDQFKLVEQYSAGS